MVSKLFRRYTLIVGLLAAEKVMFPEADHRYLILRCHPRRSSAPGTSSSR